jgi:hypothetical protein
MAEIDDRDEAFLRAEIVIDGRIMRTLSPASYLLLRKLGNAFVSDGTLPDNQFAPAVEWIMIHTLPLADVRAVIERGDWHELVERQMQLIPLAEVLRAMPKIRADMSDVAAASVEVLPGKPGEAVTHRDG